MTKVEDGVERAGLGLTVEEREEGVAVGMDLPGLSVRQVAGLKLLDNVRDTRVANNVGIQSSFDMMLL